MTHRNLLPDADVINCFSAHLLFFLLLSACSFLHFISPYKNMYFYLFIYIYMNIKCVYILIIMII